jgi:methylenetetrahydrofolate reductase (NADPH)
MRTSIELVPRSRRVLLADTETIRTRFDVIDTINIPDLTRFSLRSWDAAALLAPIVRNRIPHLRARDHASIDIGALAAALTRADVREVIVIAGDPAAASSSGDATSISPLALIETLARRLPAVTVYAAVDPYAYRHDAMLRANIRHKRDAGATGFFSQPLFSLDELRRCAVALGSVPVFWGLSPVTSPESRRYWERVNRVRFPHTFEPTLAWNLDFAREMLEVAADRGDNAYLMPIRMSLEQYIAPLYPCIARHARPRAAATPRHSSNCSCGSISAETRKNVTTSS